MTPDRIEPQVRREQKRPQRQCETLGPAANLICRFMWADGVVPVAVPVVSGEGDGGEFGRR